MGTEASKNQTLKEAEDEAASSAREASINGAEAVDLSREEAAIF